MATTADILGFTRTAATHGKWSRHYRGLCAERDRLVARDCSRPESSAAKLDDLTDAGSDETMGGIALMAAAMTMSTLQEVVEAIRRIERGTYGICEITGQPIEPERLSEIPWTRFSYAGQDLNEKEGGCRRARLPALQVVMENERPAEDDEAET